MPRQEKSPPPAATQDPVLQRYATQFRALRAQLAELGFFCKGTVLARRMTCGKPACACATEPARRHGPYFEWTYKVAGKTVHHRLSPHAGKIYQEGSAQYRKLKSLLRRMERLSRRALARKAKPR